MTDLTPVDRAPATRDTRPVADMLRKVAEAFRHDPARSSWLPHWKQREKAVFADSLDRRARRITSQHTR